MKVSPAVSFDSQGRLFYDLIFEIFANIKK